MFLAADRTGMTVSTRASGGRATHASRAYVGYRGGLRVIDEPGPAAGTATPALEGRDVECVAAVGETVLAGTFEDGLFRSTNAGDDFERVGEDGIEPDAVTAVAVSPHDPDVVWVGTEPSRVFQSRDGGSSFERLSEFDGVPSATEWSFPPRPETHHVRWIEPAPDDPDRWYVGIEAGALLVTEDGGETWMGRPPGSRRDNHTLATHPEAPDRVYAAAGDGYAESTDRGASWRTVHEGLEHRYVWGLAVDPGDPDAVIVSAAADANAAHRRGEAYLYRKRPARDVASTAGSDAASEAAVDATSRAAGDAASEAESSGSAGATWERLDDRGVSTGTGTHRAVLAGGRAPGEVWLCHDDGLHVTTDGGDCFTRVPVDLPAAVPRALAVV